MELEEETDSVSIELCEVISQRSWMGFEKYIDGPAERVSRAYIITLCTSYQFFASEIIGRGRAS